MLTRSRLVGSLAFFAVLALTGCNGFFFKEATTSTGTGTGTGSGTNLVFVANTGGSSVSGFSISTTGVLSQVVGSPIALIAGAPATLTVSRNNQYLWVGTQAQIFGFSLSSTGAITALNSGNPLQNARCSDMQTTPDGKWLMVLDGSGSSIDLFQINSADGTLAAASGASFGTTVGPIVPHALRISPSGTLVAAALGTAGELLFNFNTATGAFTPIGKAAAPPGTSSDNSIAIDPTGSYLYIARSGTAAGLIVNTINTDGTLTPTTTTPYATGMQPYAVALDSTGKYVYVANRGDGTVSEYSIGTNQALTAIAGSPATAGVAVQALGADSTGKWFLAAAFSGAPDLTLYGFDTNTPGRIFSVTSSATGTNASALALSH